MYIILGMGYNLKCFEVYEKICTDSMQKKKFMPLQARDLSVCKFWHPKGILDPSQQPLRDGDICIFSYCFLLFLFFLLDSHFHSSHWPLAPRQWHDGAGCSQCLQQLTLMKSHFLVTGSQPILSSGPSYRCNHSLVYLPEMRWCYFINYKENIQRSGCHAAGAAEAWFSDEKLRN